MNLSYQDILVRVQYLAQYIADFGYIISTRMAGGKWVQEDFNKLSLLIIYADTLVCNLPTPETIAVGQILINSVTGTGTINSITVGGVDILGQAISGGTPSILADNIVTEINNYISLPDYTAVSNGDYIFIYGAQGTGSSADGSIAVNVTSCNTTVTSDVIGGVDAGTIEGGCLTNDELGGIFTHVSTLTGYCFQPAGSHYISDECPELPIDTLVDDSGGPIVTVTGEVVHIIRG